MILFHLPVFGLLRSNAGVDRKIHFFSISCKLIGIFILKLPLFRDEETLFLSTLVEVIDPFKNGILV